MKRKVIYVTSRCPFENWEIWAIREMNSLVEEDLDLIVVPRTGYGRIIQEDAKKLASRTIATPFVNLPIIACLLKKIFTEPFNLIFILKWIINQSNSFSDFFKGLVVLPKSLYIGNKLKKKGVEHVHAFSTTSVAVVAFILSNELKVPWSVTFHASWVINNSYRRSVFTHMKSVSFARVISREVERCLSNYIGSTLSKKINVLHIGVQCNELLYENQILNSNKVFNIASAGWLLPHKGIDVSFKAARNLLDKGITNFKWFFYGDGPLLKTLSAQMVDLKLENNVVLAGAIDNKKLLNKYKNHEIDLFILNSVKRNGIQEGIPVSLMEAMSYSIPVIASNCGGTNELVDGKSGILLSENDSEGTANAIADLISDHNKVLLQGQEGREKVFNEFNTHKIARQLIKLFLSDKIYKV